MKDTQGLNTRGLDNRGGDQGRMDLEFGGEQMFGEDGGSTEFRWMRGSVREEQIRNKGNTKGGNDRIGKEQGRSEVSEKGQRRRPEWDLTERSEVEQVVVNSGSILHLQFNSDTSDIPYLLLFLI